MLNHAVNEKLQSRFYWPILHQCICCRILEIIVIKRKNDTTNNVLKMDTYNYRKSCTLQIKNKRKKCSTYFQHFLWPSNPSMKRKFVVLKFLIYSESKHSKVCQILDERVQGRLGKYRARSPIMTKQALSDNTLYFYEGKP